MPQVISAAQVHIRAIEALRRSRVLVLAASSLDFELLPALYEQCRTLGAVERLDVVLHCRGGIVNGARRIALLLRGFTDHLSFIVPYFCESSGTILALAADEIIAGELAIFSPIDPHLHGGGGKDEEPSSFSCLDIHRFGDMSEAWFGARSEDARLQALSLLCGSIFPPTLTAFYRAMLEVEQIGAELLQFQLPERSDRGQILQRLIYGYHSHNYAITRAELEALGLNIQRQPEVEDLAWEISKLLQTVVGRGVCQSLEESWYDALLATREGVRLRTRRPGGLLPQWTDAESAT